MSLKHGTEPLDKEAKAKRHDAAAARIVTLLEMPSVTGKYRQDLQVQLLHELGAAHALRQPAPTSHGRMKSFVGLDRYYFNG